MGRWCLNVHYTVVLVLCVVELIRTERFFQYRDHRDQSLYTNNADENKNEVQYEVQAEVSLIYHFITADMNIFDNDVFWTVHRF